MADPLHDGTDERKTEQNGAERIAMLTRVLQDRRKAAIGGAVFAGMAALGLAVVFLAPADRTQAEASALAPAACPFAIPAGERADCGTLTVPATRDSPGGPSLTLFYAITRTTGGLPSSYPILVLNGGPGQAGSELIESAWSRLAEARRQRDIIFIDQRGTGYSQPNLRCPNLDPVRYFHGGLTAEDAGACLKLATSHGIDISAFNTIESARDLVALRQALGIPKWNLLGTSYGTILAMEAVRRDGAGVRSVVLNSPTLTRTSWLDLNRMATIGVVYRQLFADCAADAACNATYPGLEDIFLKLSRRLNERPIPVSFSDPRTGGTGTAWLSFDALLNTLTILVGSGDNAGQVPKVLWHVFRVSEGLEAPAMSLLGWLYMPFWAVFDDLAYGLNAAIGCREVRPWVDAQSARASATMYKPYVSPLKMELDYDVFCPVWNVPRGPDTLRQPVASEVPVLLLTGQYDTLTPTNVADVIAKTLPRAQIVRYRGFGHDPLWTSACAQTTVAHFLAAPGDPATPTCSALASPPTFDVSALGG